MVDNMVAVSVIVACYNVEQYVAMCIESLLKQDATSYELVLVDDGSTDATGAILDGYANIPWVSVVHKANGGLSDARNAGVLVAHGLYVTFVDGDDYVSPRYVSTLLSLIGTRESCIAVAALTTVAQNSGSSWTEVSQPHVIHADTTLALEMLLRNDFTESACAKLFPISIVREHPFPKGRFFEDLFSIGSFITHVDDVVISDESIYAYVIRKGSIVRARSVSFRKIDDYLDALKSLLDCASKCPGIHSEYLMHRILLTYSRLRSLLIKVDSQQERAHQLMSAHVRYARSHTWAILTSRHMDMSDRARFLLLGWVPSLHDQLLLMNQKSKGV